MNPNEVFQRLESLIRVTPQQVAIAKAFILKNFNSNSFKMIQGLLEEMEARMPDKIVIHKSVDTEGMIKSAAEAISWTLAGCEAIWGLISANLLIPASLELRHLPQHLGWTTVVPGSGGSSGGWNLHDLSLTVPNLVLLPRSNFNRELQPLSDPDLFLHALEILNIHKEVEESLREAVRCFRHELFLACLAMLGRASEGAWIELGLKLTIAVPQEASLNSDKIKEKLQDPFVGIGKKILETLRLYERTEIFGRIREESGVTVQDLRNAVIWADVIRESRNSIHYGVEPSMPNTYEKVAALLIGAVPHLRLLYRVAEAVDRAIG